ncbi:MAG: carbohydrate ABC transporter permease [Christensenellales bacterium]|jgi:putative aldouronate transport system permease protein
MQRRSQGERVFSVFNTLMLLLISMITLYPILYVLFASVSDPARFMSYGGILTHPLGFQLGSYRLVISNRSIGTGYLNTLFLVVVGTSFNVMFTALAAYVLSRRDYYWKRFLNLVVVITMLFSGGLIPFYLVVQKVGLGDSLWALIIPGLITTSNLMIMRTSFAAVPPDLEESAKIDGAGDWRVLFQIVLPLSKAVIAVMVLFYGVNHWNGWFNAAIFLRNRTRYPLQLILREILISNDTNAMTTDLGANDAELVAETIKYATIVVATLPIMCVYPFVQRYFVTGVMLGSIKG